MTVSDRVNTEQWDANSVVLIQSRLAKIHRNMVLKRSRLHDLLTDQNKKILDLGCGSGPFLRYFAERGFKNLYAVEPDADLVRGIPTDFPVELETAARRGLSSMTKCLTQSSFTVCYIISKEFRLTRKRVVRSVVCSSQAGLFL